MSFGCLSDLLAVLIGSRQKEGLVALQAMPAGKGVCIDRAVGVTDVRRIIDVVDRRRHVKAAHDKEAYRPFRAWDALRPWHR